MAAEDKIIQIEFRESGAENVARKVKGMGQASQEAGSQVSKFQSLLLKLGGIAAVTTALKKATDAALGFGSAMAEVSTLLPDNREMGLLTENVKALAVQFGSAPTEQAKALYQVISAGASDAAQATEILSAANKLAIGGVTDVMTAADGLTSTLNAYGDAAGSATDVSDAFFTAVKAGKTTVDELSSSIGTVAPIASASGVSLEELLAATAALTKGGLQTSVAMNQLKAAMSNVIKPSSEATELAEELGLNFSASGLKAKGFAQFLAEVQKATGGSTEKMAKLFGSVEAVNAVIALTGKASQDFASVLREMGSRAGATNDAFEKMSQTAQFKLNRFLAALNIIMVDIGNTVLTVLAPVFETLAENMDIAKVAAAGFGAALIAMNFSAIVSGIGSMTLAVKGFTLALLANPVTFWITALTAVIATAVALNKKFQIFEPTWEILSSTFELVVNKIKQGINVMSNYVTIAISTIKDSLYSLQIAAAEVQANILSYVGSDEAYQGALASIEKLKEEQKRYAEEAAKSGEERIKENAALDEQNKKLQENISLNREKFFAERGQEGTGNPAGGASPGAAAGAPRPDLTSDIDKEAQAQKRLNEMKERGLILTQQLRTPTEIYKDRVKELNELLESGAITQETYNRGLKKYEEELGRANDKTDEFGDTFKGIIDGTLNSQDLFVQGAKQVVLALIDMNLEAGRTKNAFQELAGSGFGGGGGGGFLGSLASIAGNVLGAYFFPGAPTQTLPAGAQNATGGGIDISTVAANGDAYSYGRLHKFANGGVFNSPVSFPMVGNNTGLMAEAGPEAIMPLRRGRDGRLGVEASGGGGAVVNVSVVDQRSGGEKAQVSETRDANGNRSIRVLIRDEVKRGFGEGAFDKSLKQFGVTRGGSTV